MDFIIPRQKFSEINVGNDGVNIYIRQGNNVIQFPAVDPYSGKKISQKVRIAVKRNEEKVEKNLKLVAEQLVKDSALLLRLGIPVGLTNDKYILKEAGKEAYHGTDLRKYITGNRAKGIESREFVGEPALIKHKPKKEVKNG